MKIFGFYILGKSKYLVPDLHDRLLDFIDNYDTIKRMNRLRSSEEMADYLVKTVIKDLIKK